MDRARTLAAGGWGGGRGGQAEHRGPPGGEATRSAWHGSGLYTSSSSVQTRRPSHGRSEPRRKLRALGDDDGRAGSSGVTNVPSVGGCGQWGRLGGGVCRNSLYVHLDLAAKLKSL